MPIMYLEYLQAAVPPLTFLLTLWALLSSRASRRATLYAALGALAAECVVQALLLSLDDGPLLAATLLPLTLYLPAILWTHLLSGNSSFSTALTWMLALLCGQMLAALRKLLSTATAAMAGPARDWALTIPLLLAAALLLLLVYRFLRAPFLAYARERTEGWPPLLFLPAMLLILYSYFLSSTTDVTAIALLFLTALAFFLVLARLIVSLAAERQARDSQRQMEALRRDYELLQKKLALGRGYRHDLRHHITALLALLQQGEIEDARRYVAQWQGQLTKVEAETWCRNTAVNAVLSVYLTQIRESGCALEADVSLPERLPFEETDLCVVLANALENAAHACEALPEGRPRHVKLSATLTGDRRLTVSVENSCSGHMEFDQEGFPIVPRREGHGQGLRSIAAVAEKYSGMFQCGCDGDVFTLRVVLLDRAVQPRPQPRLRTALLTVLLLCFLLNCMPALAQALETVPVLGQAVRVVDLRTYVRRWGSTGTSVQAPVLEGDPAVVESVEARQEALLQQMRERFLWQAARKYQGYVAQDVSYEVVRDDGALFILRFQATLNAGGSVDYQRYLILDKQSDKILELSDLFQPEANYVFPISREIKAQMAEQMNAGEGDYFLPGGIWSDEECFQSIDPQQNFYIDGEDHLVIVFDEYEVAPGSMGTPEFLIPTDCLDGILAQPSILR